MDLGLTGKSALVLASSGGLGRATALAFAREGADVTLFARREAETRAAQQDIKTQTGRDAHVVIGDLTKAADIQRAVDEAAAKFGRLDILVNNCGGPPAGTFDAFDDATWQAAYELTLLSYVRSTRAALPHLRKAGRGWIINFVSSSVKAPLELLLLSNTFRMGVIGLTKTLAGEVGPQGILVNALGPGRVYTDRIAQLDGARAKKAGTTPEQVRADMSKQIPLGRYGEPEEFARTAVFLCSPANTYISGQTLLVDGGMVKAY
ncbi:MAG: SDR family oxidoreductase [Candidatus Didemnitutus sp.]|nr:SDR family oxidoreductase [Candidatus Didemnitutus sp.]